ncbi:FtsX-like permease family protein [Luteimonas yindakuii]|uniref:ABC transporter permease n=1 Tax=Luteimonas yindakuii TaxID=2565782 RepID=UPI00110770E8|nr:FtsX-like permease family protein [Luteimonas yindakuii]QCU72735.1 FtsX-like permease family protein [Luteimonas yindakuii]
MELRPILSTLSRHKTAAALIVFEIALSCAIVCNALFLIAGRLERIDRPTGADEQHVVTVQARGLARDENANALTQTDLAALRAIPGVANATISVQMPFGNSNWNSSVRMTAEQRGETMSVSNYIADEHLIDTLGLKLVAGRNFTRDEVGDFGRMRTEGKVHFPAVILGQATADRLFPAGDALGKGLYIWGEEPSRVIGIVERLAKPNDFGSAASYEESVILPGQVPYSSGAYLVRVQDPSQRQAVLEQAQKALLAQGPTRIVDAEQARTLESMRDRYYRQDRAMAWMLVAVIVALLVVTALGIVGLASFWVQQRSRQIGIRRALGATRGQILRYFQTENFLLATIGIAIGMLLAYALNQLLMQRYELPRLPLFYLPIGAVALWLLGQIAVYGPARRAALVPPAVATRGA